MSDLKMGTAEARFADIIWKKEPITSVQLTKNSLAEFNRKKTTCVERVRPGGQGYGKEL